MNGASAQVRTEIRVASARRRLPPLAETGSGACVSAASNCRPEDIGISRLL